MAVDPAPADYVRDALLKGMKRTRIRSALATAGWTESEIEAALAVWMVQDDGAGVVEGAGVVPRPIRSSAARDAFFYALLFVVFAMVAGNVLTLLFGQIDYWLPEPGEVLIAYGWSSLRWSMAALIVFTPAFWLLNRTDARGIAADPARRNGAMRRWLSSLAMLIAVMTLLGDALFLIYTWLDGQMTLRFVAKSAIVAVFAMVVLGYFRDGHRLPLLFRPVSAAWALIGLAVLALVLSFWVVGGPSQGRTEQRDAWRISDLRTLARDVATCAVVVDGRLPAALDPMTCVSTPARLTGYAAEVTYQRISDTVFDLCIAVEYPAALQTYDLRIEGTAACIRTNID
jgi:hypothetical protein